MKLGFRLLTGFVQPSCVRGRPIKFKGQDRQAGRGSAEGCFRSPGPRCRPEPMRESAGRDGLGRLRPGMVRHSTWRPVWMF
jgi:hypothetical protein